MTRDDRDPLASDGGAAAIELPLAVGLLLLPFAIVVLSFPVWIERLSMARVAAQEAARVAVLADDPDAAATAASAIVDAVARNHAVDPTDISLCWSVHDVGASAPACGRLGHLPRGAAVTAHVTIRLPALAFPGIGATLDAISRTVTHTERVDRYRSFPGG